MLNLVAIPKIKIQNTKSKKRKSEKGRQPKGNVTFVKSTQLLYFIVSMFFQMKLEGLGPRKLKKKKNQINEFIKIRDIVFFRKG